MKNFLKKSLLALFLLNLVFIPIKANAYESNYFKDEIMTKSICDLKTKERQLWIEHVLWTRSYIVSAISDLEDKDVVLQRLLKNQDDIGNSIKPYYGEEAGNKLSSLLREHIELAGQVLDSAKNKDTNSLEKYSTLWYENADKIADFLSAANPNYSNKALKDMLYKHLEFVTEQVTSRLDKDWKADINSYDKGQEHMIHFADILSDGIIKQFPEKFK